MARALLPRAERAGGSLGALWGRAPAAGSLGALAPRGHWKELGQNSFPLKHQRDVWTVVSPLSTCHPDPLQGRFCARADSRDPFLVQ